MFAGRYILAIIPARGGSKRLPRKNVLPLNGTPLIQWSIRTALACPYVDAVVVSTDDAEIAQVSSQAGALVRQRPEALAQDHSPSLPVFVDALQHHSTAADIVLVLQPTSPFRQPTDLSDAIQKMVEQDADALISVSKNKLGPEWALMVKDGILQMPSPEALDRVRTQDQVARYSPNGNLYAYTRATLLQAEKYAFGEKTLALVTEPPYDIDIDDATDFKIAEAIAHEFHFHCP